MTIYKVHSDTQNFQSFQIDSEDLLDLLDPYIGEQKAFVLGTLDTRVSSYWEPLDISFFHNEGTIDLPDVGECGHGLFVLNPKAYDALAELLEPYGEFLPCNLLGDVGYIFHCCNSKGMSDAQVSYREHEGTPVEVESLAFPNVTDDFFKARNAVTFDFLCSDRFVNAAQSAGLKGLVFAENLAARSLLD